MSTAVLIEVISTSLPIVAAMAALVSVLGAVKSGAVKRIRFGNLELASGKDQDKEVEALEASIRQSLNKEQIPFEVEQLTNYYSQILAQSKISFWFSLVFASLGFVAILLAAFLYTDGNQGTTVAQFVAGLIMEAVASLFFVQSRNAQQSMGDFFDKLRKDRLHMESRKLCDAIESQAVKDALKLNLALHYAGVGSAEVIAKQISESLLTISAQQSVQPDRREDAAPG